MIEESYVSFEIAKLLKEKGFNEPCIAVWNDLPEFILYGKLGNYNKTVCYSAPTQQLACRWLREMHNILIIVGIDLYKFEEGEVKFYIEYYNLKNPQKSCSYEGEYIYFDELEEAYAAAIKYCLENLI